MIDDLTRLKFLAGNLEEGVNMYAEPKADHKIKLGGDGEVHDELGHKMKHPKTSEKTGQQSGNHEKKAGGDVVKDKNEMDMHHKKGGKGPTEEPKANHSKKLGGDVVKEWAKAIVESGDAEGTVRELLAALQEAGVEL